MSGRVDFLGTLAAETGLQDAMGADVEGVVPHRSILGFPAEGWKP
ncbi:MAG: hypothetical protein AAGE65_10785 [Planctomycetota bacterium]